MNFEEKLGHMGMRIPEHTQDTLEGYFLRGWQPGGFVESMLALDMERALATADTGNRQAMWVIGRWIIENAPTGSWGNYSNVDAWCRDLNSCRSKWATWYELQKDHTPKDYSF